MHVIALTGSMSDMLGEAGCELSRYYPIRMRRLPGLEGQISTSSKL
jgi:hypothetical protein